ncbi:MAG TPA: type II toxin-antitoxin system RelE/ParE family toxin [Flavobacterium sp.]|nr:type II toxin-antitoxin system RelE/ParE family toxin [Flavobacterium sp.]
MKIIFEKQYLEDLYTEGKAKKYIFQKDVVRKYKQTIDKLRVATRIEDLFVINSLNYEVLSGKKDGISSVRVDRKYRIEFKVLLEGQEPHTITICSIMELSNHYK